MKSIPNHQKSVATTLNQAGRVKTRVIIGVGNPDNWWYQDYPPQDYPLVGNPEVGNPDIYQILCAHIWSQNVHSFCEWCEPTKILTRYQNWIFFTHIWCFLCEKTEGGSDNGEILVACILDHLQKKVKHSVFVSAPVYGENGLQV